jgi:hypothetical protein
MALTSDADRPSAIARALRWLHGPLISRARQHLLPLGIVFLITVGAQIMIQLQAPHVVTYSDSGEYLAVARRLLAGDLTPASRRPM